MSRDDAAPGSRILSLWRLLRPLPGGEWIFSRVLGWMVPYSGTTRPRVRELEPGRCVVELPDRRRVRNHLDSLHAAALANVGELATGMATLAALPPDARGILVDLSASYEAKARGRITARCRTEVPEVEAALEHRARAGLRNGDGEVVARVEATWRLAPTDADGAG